jgi:hypothetical protein
MPAKKRATSKAKKNRTVRRSSRDAKLSRVQGDVKTILAWGDNIGIMLSGDDEERLPSPKRNGRARKEPYYINPETAEQRRQRLAARKALTLKAANIAYENHHRRKTS